MPNDPPPPPAGHAESAGSSTASPVPLAAATAGATPTQGRNAPARGQLVPLSTKREESSIPKGGAGGTWLYPSPQMFFNALLRKDKAQDVHERDMNVVVAIHNNMNERTWRKVLEWERVGGHCATCPTPRLVRFQGRPHDLTPKARLKSWLGYGLPFDRHDWVVDRCGTLVRYVIDYYHREQLAAEDEVPDLHSREKIKSITVDVRPALDCVGNFFDRVVMSADEVHRWLFASQGGGRGGGGGIGGARGAAQPQPQPQAPGPGAGTAPHRAAGASAGAAADASCSTAAPGHAPARAAAAGGPRGSKTEAARIIGRQIQSSCADAFRAVRECETDVDCTSASVSLSHCMASHVPACKGLAAAFRKAAHGAGDGHDERAINTRFAEMQTCLDLFERSIFGDDGARA